MKKMIIIMMVAVLTLSVLAGCGSTKTTPLTSVTVIARLFWISCTKPMRNPTKATLRRLVTVLRNWRSFCACCLWKIIMQFLTSAADCVAHMNAKLSVTDCNTAHIL